MADVKKENFTDILLLGMGGSSLCPDVLAMTFGKIAGFPQLHVLDSTDPAQVKAAENKVNLARTLFIVSSKSGTTLEPNIFKQYFFERVKQTIGAEKAGSRFIAITDPGSKMQQVAEADRFRHIFPGLPSIGGRYSALSNFGVVPGALMGLDMSRFLARTQEMVEACGAGVPVEQNPGALLGIVLGTAARSGRDKLTLIASPGISALGAWLEQLVAESTGKQGKGIVPVDREDIGPPEVYGNDRVFAYVRLESAPDKAQDAKVAALEQAGHPVVRIPLGDIYDLGQEFFRWEIATAIVGSIIRINAFNQPDVEASKIATRNLTTEYEKTGSLPAEKPVLEDGGIKLFTDAVNAEALAKAAGSDKTLAGYLRAHHQARGCRRLLCPAGLHPDEYQSTKRFCRNCAWRCATGSGWPPVSNSGRASFIPRARPTRADRTAASFCRSPATMPPTCPCPGRSTLLAWSKRRRPGETSRCWRNVDAGRCGSIWARTWQPASSDWRPRFIKL